MTFKPFLRLALSLALYAALWGCSDTREMPTTFQPKQPTMDERHALARDIRALPQQPDETPMREIYNRLHSPPLAPIIATLDDPSHVYSPEERRDYHYNLIQAVGLAKLGQGWPKPGVFMIPKAKAPVRLDGQMSDPAWAYALTLTQSYVFNHKEPDPNAFTQWKMLWDDNYLYVGYTCRDATPAYTPGLKHDAPVYQDDCVELYISPDARFRSYWEIDVTPQCVVYDAIQGKLKNQWGPDVDLTASIDGLITRSHPTSPGSKPGYTVELALPWSAILAQKDDKPRPGYRYTFMLTRLDWSGTKITPYAFVPVLGWAHNIWNMATMQLAD